MAFVSTTAVAGDVAKPIAIGDGETIGLTYLSASLPNVGRKERFRGKFVSASIRPERPGIWKSSKAHRSNQYARQKRAPPQPPKPPCWSRYSFSIGRFLIQFYLSFFTP
jgi:hypothetical protein